MTEEALDKEWNKRRRARLDVADPDMTSLDEANARAAAFFQTSRLRAADFVSVSAIPDGERLVVLSIDLPRWYPSRPQPEWRIVVVRADGTTALTSLKDESKGGTPGRDAVLTDLRDLVLEHGAVSVTKQASKTGRGGAVCFVDFAIA